MFTDAQEIFLVLFSILYGVMLQSLPAGLWPLGRLLKGYKYPSGRWAHDPYGIYKWRIISSFIIFNLLPACYFYIMLNLLNNPSISYNNPIDVLFLFWGALGVFGFYRLYHVLILIKPKFKEDLRREIIIKRELSFDIWSHSVWVIFYLVPSWVYFFLH